MVVLLSANAVVAGCGYFGGVSTNVQRRLRWRTSVCVLVEFAAAIVAADEL